MLSSAIFTTNSLQSLWISSFIAHIVGVLVCGGGCIIRYWLGVPQVDYGLNIVGIIISLGRLIWISTRLPASIQPGDELKWVWISIMIYTVSLGFVKSSIVVFYFRFGNNFKLQLVAGAIVLYTIGIVIAIAIIVSDIEPVDTTKFVVTNTVLQVIFNIALACLPIKKIWKLKMSKKNKAPLFVILFLGFITITATVCGGVYRVAALSDLKSSLSWVRAELAASIEISVGVVCSSFPAWKQLWSSQIKYKDESGSFSTGVELIQKQHREGSTERPALS